MLTQQPLIAFAKRKVNRGFGVKTAQFFYDRGGQHDIADKSRLDDEYFQGTLV